MPAYDIAEEIRAALPGTEEIIVQYLSGYLVDDAGEDEDVLNIAEQILHSVAGPEKAKEVEGVMGKLNLLLADQLATRQNKKAQPKLQKLDKIMDMSKSLVSNTLAFSEGVDLESINKGKCVADILLPSISRSLISHQGVSCRCEEAGEGGGQVESECSMRFCSHWTPANAIHIQAKIEKRAKRDLYEGSKLLNQHKKQQTYEELFMKVRPCLSYCRV